MNGSGGGAPLFGCRAKCYHYLIHGPVKGLQVVNGSVQHLSPIHNATVQIVVPGGGMCVRESRKRTLVNGKALLL